MIRVLVVAASPVVRAGIEALLGRSAGVTIVGAVAPGDALGEEVEASEPDVVLVAVDGRSPNSLPSAASVARLPLSPDAVPRAPAVVVLADAPSAAWIADAVRSGVRGVLPGDATGQEIFAAVEAAAAGLVSLPAEMAEVVLGAGARPAPPARAEGSAPAQPLTAREVEVLGILAEGLANKQVAGRLGISEHTVKTHVAAILAKLDAYTRAEAVAIGARLGVILL